MATTVSQDRRSTPKQRLDWVDLIKASSVVLVVLLHVTQTLDFAVGDTIASDAWTNLMTFLEPLRMPVFFVVSGMLAASAVKRPWAQVKSRTIGILYLYILWHTLMTIFTIVVELATKGYLADGVAGTIHDYVFQMMLTPGGYWYFYALALYFVIAKLTRNINPWLVLGVAATVNLARPVTNEIVGFITGPFDVSNMFSSVALNAVYFLAGVILVNQLRTLPGKVGNGTLFIALAVALGGSTLRLMVPEIRGWSFLPIAIAWVVAAILLASKIDHLEPLQKFGRYVGPRTLPIFVIQFPILHVMYRVLGANREIMENSGLLQAIYPVVLTLAITVFALWAYDKAMAGNLTRLLFKAPASWTAAPARPAAVAAAAAPVAAAPVAAAASGTTETADPDTAPAIPTAVSLAPVGTETADNGPATADPAPQLRATDDSSDHTGETPVLVGT